jgi:hypothetical protein
MANNIHNYDYWVFLYKKDIFFKLNQYKKNLKNQNQLKFLKSLKTLKTNNKN